MLKKILFAVMAVVLVLVVVIATRPAEFEVKRTGTMKAPPEIVFAQVVDFKAWAAWSPWDKLDPQMKRTYSGAAAGVGAKYEWTGDKVGAGSMAILEAVEGKHIAIDLQFTEPIPAKNPTVFDFEKTADGTTVTWKMNGHNNFMGKAFALFVDMDKMVGGDFENGLAAMKTVSETAAAEAAKKAADEAAAAAAAVDPSDAGTP